MSEAPPALEKKEKNWIARILKLVFILSALLLVGITVLANMGGSNDSLKDSVEKFVGEVFHGRATKVEKLVNMSFFPKLGFNAEGINVLSKPKDGSAIVEIGKVQIYMGFWNVVFRNPRIATFYLEDFRAIKGAMGPKEFYVEKIFIDHDAQNASAKLRGNGKIGDNLWSFNIDVGVSGSKGKYSYMFNDQSAFTFGLADIRSSGVFINHEDGYFKLQDLQVKYDDIVLSGDLVLSALGKRMLKLKGDVTSSENQNVLSPDLLFDYARSPVKIEGSVSSSSGADTDMDSILSLFVKLRDIVGYNTPSKDSQEHDWSALFDFNDVKLSSPLAQE